MNNALKQPSININSIQDTTQRLKINETQFCWNQKTNTPNVIIYSKYNTLTILTAVSKQNTILNTFNKTKQVKITPIPPNCQNYQISNKRNEKMETHTTQITFL